MNLVRCKNCIIVGHIRTLAQITPDGNLLIERHTKSNHRDETIVIGTQFMLMCSTCNTKVLLSIERRQDEVIGIGTTWIYRNTFNQSAQANGAYGNPRAQAAVGTA